MPSRSLARSKNPLRLSALGDLARSRAGSAVLLILVCALGLLLRLLPSPLHGYEFDIALNQGWAWSAAHLGLARSYSEQMYGNMLPNYPPFGLIIFAGIGYMYQFLRFLAPSWNATVLFAILIKVPAMLADIATALLLGSVVRHVRGRVWGIFAVLLYLLHPVAWYDSSFWGQVDSIFTLFLFSALLLAVLDRPLLAGGMLALSLLTKVQGIFLLPLFLFLFLRKPSGIPRALLGFSLVCVAVLLPFRDPITLSTIARIYLESIGYYPTITSGAFTFWYALLGEAAGSTFDSTLLFGIASYRFFGFVLFGLSAVFILDGLFWKVRKVRSVSARLLPTLTAAALFSFAFFLFSTEMHERYLFPFVVFGFPLVFQNTKSLVLYAATCLLFLLNIMSSMPATPVDIGLFDTFGTARAFIATGEFFLFLILLGDYLSTKNSVRAS